ncbi:hypothetical protein [Neisseria sp.]|uniref:hypothetical protein n=1 Tax=Neisseria sp. TaxID=192066 RepID=UPI0035A099D7
MEQGVRCNPSGIRGGERETFDSIDYGVLGMDFRLHGHGGADVADGMVFGHGGCREKQKTIQPFRKIRRIRVVLTE